MTILLTGGTGKTSTRLAQLLESTQNPYLLASRKAAPGKNAVRFDWLDPATHEAPFQHATAQIGKPISAIYLVAPEGVMEPADVMNDFIKLAAQKHGVRRFVLLGGSSLVKGAKMHVGKVWEFLAAAADGDDVVAGVKGLEYAVLRPTWFMENLLEPHYASPVKKESKLYSATGSGKIPFVSTKDIAAVAFRALTDNTPHNTDHLILGPQLLTYDDVAAKLTTVLGREIVHVKFNQEQETQRFLDAGLNAQYAGFLAWLETEAAKGSEDRTNDVVETVTGRKAQTLEDFARENKEAWSS